MRKLRTWLLLPLALSCAAAFADEQATTDHSMNAAPSTSAQPDNSRVNTRDKAGVTATPEKQTNASADRHLLADVRKSVVNDKSLSTAAHNVKIVVAGGIVTLRGPVKTSDEKAKVEALAKQVSGVSAVDNQLEVKAQ